MNDRGQPILLVDDEESILSSLRRLFRPDGYSVFTASSAEEGLRVLENNQIWLVISDNAMMPGISGILFLEQVHKRWPDTVRIMLTGHANLDSAMDAINHGEVYRFVPKPWDQDGLRQVVKQGLDQYWLVEENSRMHDLIESQNKQLRGWNESLNIKIEDEMAKSQAIVDAIGDAVSIKDPNFRVLYQNRIHELLFGEHLGEICYLAFEGRDQVCENCPAAESFNDARIHTMERSVSTGEGWTCLESTSSPLFNAEGEIKAVVDVSRDMTQRKRMEESLKESLEKLTYTLEGTIQAMALAVEMRDPYTAGHQRRVAKLARAIAREMGLSEGQIKAVYLAASIHDIGKNSVPSEILSKPGRLSNIEFSLIKVHPEISFEILKTIDSPWPIAQIAGQHHERMNGSGYPLGLFGEEILLEARILAVADVVEAMASHRPYRPSLGVDNALQEIDEKRGILFDLNVVDACLNLHRTKRFDFENWEE